jgi:Domain of unknown function (DUF4193)
MAMADDIDQNNSFDEVDLAEGFDAEDLTEVEPDGEELESEDVIDAEDIDEEDVDDADDAAGVVEDEAVVEAEPVVGDDEDDLTLDQDVELALDEVLAETMRLTTDVDEDDEAVPEPEDKGELGESVLPKQDDEFRCKSCRLLKKMSQLADRDRMFCRDCV